MSTGELLRVAVPNKGSLAEPASSMLREAGYRQRADTRELVLQDPDNGAEFFFLRPRDIAIYVGSGTVDAGITGRDLLLDSASSAAEVWMAAEYESNAEAAEEISQLLYHLQVLMLAKGISLDDVYAHL